MADQLVCASSCYYVQLGRIVGRVPLHSALLARGSEQGGAGAAHTRTDTRELPSLTSLSILSASWRLCRLKSRSQSSRRRSHSLTRVSLSLSLSPGGVASVATCVGCTRVTSLFCNNAGPFKSIVAAVTRCHTAGRSPAPPASPPERALTRRRALHCATLRPRPSLQMAMAPSPPRSLALSCARLARTRQRQSCRT